MENKSLDTLYPGIDMERQAYSLSDLENTDQYLIPGRIYELTSIREEIAFPN